MRYAVIMAGGSGTRLWPLSRAETPKQLLRMIRRPGDEQPRSLLELAAQRINGLVPTDRQFICTGESFRKAICRDLPQFSDRQILGEPIGRDTVNAVGFAAAVLERMDPEAVFAIVTGDHLIEPVAEFQRLMDVGFQLVEADGSRLVTFAIEPTYAATGFGWVERGEPINDPPSARGLAYRVIRFEEKPPKERAEEFLKSGRHGWNSGMFVWKASTVMACLREYAPQNHDGLRRIQTVWGTNAQPRVLEEVYPTLPKTSIDYAVMEPATDAARPKPKIDGREVHVCTVRMKLSWLDVGSWPSFGETLTPDARGNRVADISTTRQGSGELGPCESLTVLTEAQNNLIVNAAAGHTIALLGCEKLIIVHTPDVTLIMPADRAGDLKTLHAKLPPHLV